MALNRIRDIPPDRIYYVSPEFVDDWGKHKYSTIQAAIDQAHTDHGGTFGVLINVYPGTYTEQIHSYPGYFIVGEIHNAPSSEMRVSTLYNTGVDPDHYPMRGNDGDFYILHNMNIQTDVGGTFGKLGNDRYVSCNFQGGAFIESTWDVAIFETWSDCAFVNCPAFNLTGIVPNAKYLTFENCWFGWWNTTRFESTHTGAYAVFDMDRGHLAFTKLSIKGDWYHFAKNYHSYGAYRHDYGTTAGISYRGVTISNGIHFLSDPDVFQMANCDMLDSAEMPLPPDQPDIIADVPITDVIFTGNSMFNGLAGEIQIIDPVKNVGGSAQNKYFNLVEAVKSITDEAIVVLHEDQTAVPKFTMPSTGVVQIDGKSAYSLTFAGDIADLGLNDKLVFDNCSTIVGGTVNINGNNAEFHMHGCICPDNIFQILATSGIGAKIHLHNSNLNGSVGHSPLQINSADPSIRLVLAALTGATGQPAIEYTALSLDKSKIKQSTFIHGDGGTNSPITYTGAGKVKFAMYLCGLNAAWNPATFTNTIGSANNTTDPNIDF